MVKGHITFRNFLLVFLQPISIPTVFLRPYDTPFVSTEPYSSMTLTYSDIVDDAGLPG